MSQARIDEIEALRTFRTSIVKFAEAAGVAMGDSESELSRTLGWLEHEQNMYWASAQRKRAEAVERAKEALRMKQIHKSAAGSRQSTVEEEKALAVAQRSLAEAVEKLENCRRYARVLDKAIHVYKGSMQRLGTTVSSDLPAAAAQLDKMFKVLEAYAAMAPTMATADIAGSQDGGSMARASRQAVEVLPPTDMGVGPDPLEMRLGTPPSERRAAATPSDIPPGPWAAGIVDDAQCEAVKSLNLQNTGVGADDRIIIGSGIETSPRIYLDRAQPAGAGDTGWYAGPGTAIQSEILRVVSVRDLLTIRPDLRQILTLPWRLLVVIGPTGIEAIIDDAANDLWVDRPPTATAPAEAASETPPNPGK